MQVKGLILIRYFLLLLLFLFTLPVQGRRKKVAEPLRLPDPQNFSISVESMNPMRFTSRTVSYGYSLRLHGDSVSLYLPYMGEVYQPDFSSEGLNFDLPITELSHTLDRKGRIHYSFRTRRGMVLYLIRLELQPSGHASIYLRPSNADAVSYEGQVEL